MSRSIARVASRGLLTFGSILGLSLMGLAHPASAVTSAALDLHQDDLWLAHAFGAGTDLTIAVVERDACIERNHKDFQTITFLPRIPNEPCDPSYGTNGGVYAHATKVTSALASVRFDSSADNEYAGLFGARIFESISFSDAVIERQPEFINISQTTAPINAFDIDRAVYEDRIFVTNGSGNRADGTALCWAYNSVCVGGYNHADTIQHYSDDTWAGGSYLNPSVSGREEPDLVGVSYQSLAHVRFPGDTEGRENESGTSYASPNVLGLAALLTANYRADLDREPTLLRAVLLASASHPIDRRPVPNPRDAYDDRVGVGAPRGDRAAEILGEDAFYARSLDRDIDFDTETGRLDDAISFRASVGETIRVAAAWDQCPVRMTTDTDALVVDLDMTIRGPLAPLEFPMEVFEDRLLGGMLWNRASPGTMTSGALTSSRVATSTTTLTTTTPTTSYTAPTISESAIADTQLDFGMAPVVRQNHSKVDNWEIVEFHAPVSGTYSVELRSARWNRCPYDDGMRTHVAVAWDVY